MAGPAGVRENAVSDPVRPYPSLLRRYAYPYILSSLVVTRGTRCLLDILHMHSAIVSNAHMGKLFRRRIELHGMGESSPWLHLA